MRLAALTILFPLLCLGCRDSATPVRTVSRDSAGTAIHSYDGPDVALEWTFARTSGLGGMASGPESFYQLNPGQIGTDGHGHIYVLNAPEALVAKFDSLGTFVEAFGRQGEGPGEFSSPSTLAVHNDGVVAVFDFARMGLVTFFSDGHAGPVQSFPYPPRAFTQPHFAPWGEGWAIATTAASRGGGSELQLLAVTATDTTVLARMPQPKSEMAVYPPCGGGLRLPPVFSPDIVWDASGSLVGVATGPTYEVEVVGTNGNRRSVRRALKPTPATQALAEQELGEGQRINFGRGPCLIPSTDMISMRGFAEVVPLIEHIALNPDGGLWVQRRVPGAPGSGPIDVFDSVGRYVGTLEHFPMPTAFLSSDRVAVMEASEEGGQRLAIGRIVR